MLISLPWVTYFFPGARVDSGSPEACGLRVWSKGWFPKAKSGNNYYRVELGKNNSNNNNYPIHSPLNRYPTYTYAPKQQMSPELGKRETDISKLEHR